MFDEKYLLLMLSDSNLPTGGFISSSGLESYIQHGLLLESSNDSVSTSLLSFISKSLHTFAKTNLPFLREASASLQQLALFPPSAASMKLSLKRLVELDHQFESMTLNHVAKRNSKQQGMALLTLYERSLSHEVEVDEDDDEEEAGKKEKGSVEPKKLVEELKALIRNGDINGHYVVAFGVITGVLGISLSSTQHLFLFLFSRSILSSAVRLNIVGPYISTKLLLHDISRLVDEILVICKDAELEGVRGAGPSTSWPLGEILAARHDQLHSKIFNS